jgi:hypothetical protein
MQANNVLNKLLSFIYHCGREAEKRKEMYEAREARSSTNALPLGTGGPAYAPYGRSARGAVPPRAPEKKGLWVDGTQKSDGRSRRSPKFTPRPADVPVRAAVQCLLSAA